MGVRKQLPSRRDVCQGVVEAVAEMDDTSPVAIRPPLYEVIDPEALETLLDSGSSPHDLSREVGFVYGGYEVRISENDAGEKRTVAVTETGPDARQTGPNPSVDFDTGETH